MNRPATIAAATVLTFTLAAASNRAARAADTPAWEPPPAELVAAHEVAPAPEEIVVPIRAHGPDAPDGQFPSHVFQWEAHAPRRVQIGFNYGLSQPILTHGFNAAPSRRSQRRHAGSWSTWRGSSEGASLRWMTKPSPTKKRSAESPQSANLFSSDVCAGPGRLGRGR